MDRPAKLSNVTTRDGSKKLSFFSAAADESDGGSGDDLSPIQVPKADDTAQDIDLRIKTRNQKAGKNVKLNDHDAGSSCSCSSEGDQSSEVGHSDDNRHGDLDYDEDSLTGSPTNNNQQSNSLDDVPAKPEPTSRDDADLKQYENEKTDLAILNNNNNDDPNHNDDQVYGEEDEEDEEKLSRNNEPGSKLKSFININTGSNDEEFNAKDANRSGKDRSHKNYHALLKYFFKDACFFQIKSINHENVEISKSRGIWSTLVQNEMRFNAAFAEYRNVILIFSVQQSGAFQGFARIVSGSRPAVQPIPWVLPHRLNRANLGGVFDVEWLCTKDLNFNDTRNLFNPLNDNKPVKVARDGQQVEYRAGKELCMLFPRDSKKRLLKAVETLKSQVRNHRHDRASRIDHMNYQRYRRDQHVPTPMSPMMYHHPPAYIAPNSHDHQNMMSDHHHQHFSHIYPYVYNNQPPIFNFTQYHGQSRGRRGLGPTKKSPASSYHRYPSQPFNSDQARFYGHQANGFEYGPAHSYTNTTPSHPAHMPDYSIYRGPTNGSSHMNNGYFAAHHQNQAHPLRPPPLPYDDQKPVGPVPGPQQMERYHPYQRRGGRH